MTINLPDQYSLNDQGQLQYWINEEKSNVIADFYPLVLERKVLTNLTKDETYDAVIIEFFVDNVSCGSFELQLTELEKFNYESLDIRFTIPPDQKNAKKHIAYIIRNQAKTFPFTNTIEVNKLGWHNLSENERIYCAGDTIISDNNISNIKISDNLSKFKLEVDEELTEGEAIEKAFKIAEIEPNISYITYGFTLVGIMRQIFIDAGVTPMATPFIIGDSGSRKTSLVTLATNLYNRSKNMKMCCTRINSTIPAVENVMDALKDCVFIYDDLYREVDTKIKNQNERQLSEILRNYADNSSRMKYSGGKINNAQLIVTGEYIPTSKTNLARCVIITVDNGINKVRLSECQAEPRVLSTFAYHYIKWLSKNYNSIVSYIKDEFVRFREARSTKYATYERFYEAAFVLKTAMRIFCKYAIEKEALAEQGEEKIMNIFTGHITDVFSYQEKIMSNVVKKETKNINFSKELLDMLNKKVIHIGQKGSDCFRKRYFIYITCRHLCKALYEQTGYKTSSKAVSKYFADRYISIYDKDIHVKKYEGKRYLVLDPKKLVEDANSKDQEIENLFF